MNFFGTDGIRGTFGSSLTERTAFLLGKSLALLSDCCIVVVARDTRLSGERLFRALSQGVYDGGGNVINLGVMPTNAVGHFVRKLGGDFGVMITASHNPPQDNGLKVFDKYGVKLCTSKQKAVSRVMNSLRVDDIQSNRLFEPVFYDIDNIYAEDILRLVDVHLDKVSVALDCCFGASYKVAPMIFERAGATVAAYNNSANGKEINQGCGANNPQYLANKLVEDPADLAFAFDGDADRLTVFERGKLLPNNAVFYAFAKYFEQTSKLHNHTVCGTTLTNGGVESCLNKLGITLARSDVGDTNVFAKMVQNAITFGGEESGHYLLGEYATSSDAIINALVLCKIRQQMGSLFAYTKELREIPCIMRTIPITQVNQSLATDIALTATTSRINSLYNCRVVLRKSGTENAIRAYVEGEDIEPAMDNIVATFGG